MYPVHKFESFRLSLPITQISIIAGLVIFMSCSNHPEILLKRAIELDSLGKFKEAIAVYDQLLEFDTSNTSILIARAYDKGRIGDSNGEIDDLNKVVKIAPNNTLALFELGIIYGDFGDYSQSIEVFNKAIQTKGSELISLDWVKNDFIDDRRYMFDVPIADLKLERGIVYFKSDSVRKAYADLTYCIDIGHELKDSYYYRARTCLKSDMVEQACKDAKMSALYGMKEAVEIVDSYCK